MRLSAKAQITIPKIVRQTLGVQPGDEVEFTCSGTTVRLKKKVSGFVRWVGHLGGASRRDIDRTVARLRGRAR